jgi:hypothetical protein
MVSFYVREDSISTMNMKTGDFESQSENDVSDTPGTVFIDVPEELRPDDGNPGTTQDESHDTPLFHLFGVSIDIRDMCRRRSLTSTQPQSNDWIDVDTPSHCLEQSRSQHSDRSAQQRQRLYPMDLYAKASRSYHERLEQRNRDAAPSKCLETGAATCTEDQRFEEKSWLVDVAAESARLAAFRKKALQDYEEMRSSRDSALKDLSETKAQLTAIEKRQSMPPAPCPTCSSHQDKILKLRSTIKDLETDVKYLDRELEIAQGSVAGYKNSFTITHKILNEQQAEIAEQKAKIAEQKSEICRLKARITELETVPKSLSVNAEEKEDALAKPIEHTEAPEPCTSGQPLVMRIVVWVGGVDGTDTELALVKMNPDTTFKAVLKDLRRQHPRKALKQKSTGGYIFESDTPAYVSISSFFCCSFLHADNFQLGVKNGEELVFVQQNDEPMYMLDATVDDPKSWKAKGSRV